LVAALHSTSQPSGTMVDKITQIQQEQQVQTSSHKVQRLQAVVSYYGRCNICCADVADSIPALHGTRQPSHTTKKKNRNANSAGKTSSHKVQLQQTAISFYGRCN
jgi:hypothetical protein